MSPDLDVSFGAHLRRLRETAGLTQEALAMRAGLSPDAVSALERGLRRRPYPHTVRALAEALELGEEERAELVASLPRRAAPLASNNPAPPTLPMPPTPLFGRERDAREVLGALLRPDASHPA